MGVRGLCNGLGPAAFGLMWHCFGIDIVGSEVNQPELHTNLTEIYLGGNFKNISDDTEDVINVTEVYDISENSDLLSSMPGIPFLVSAFSVILALILSVFLKPIAVTATNNDIESSSNQETSSSSNSNTELNNCDDDRDRNDCIIDRNDSTDAEIENSSLPLKY